MKGMSAHAAKTPPKKTAARGQVETVYTIDDTKYTFSQVLVLVRKINPHIYESKLRHRLEGGHRELKILAADKLPQYRPKAMRGRYAL